MTKQTGLPEGEIDFAEIIRLNRNRADNIDELWRWSNKLTPYLVDETIYLATRVQAWALACEKRTVNFSELPLPLYDILDELYWRKYRIWALAFGAVLDLTIVFNDEIVAAMNFDYDEEEHNALVRQLMAQNIGYVINDRFFGKPRDHAQYEFEEMSDFSLFNDIK
jgi:hypothetical protein